MYLIQGRHTVISSVSLFVLLRVASSCDVTASSNNWVMPGKSNADWSIQDTLDADWLNSFADDEFRFEIVSSDWSDVVADLTMPEYT